MWRRRNFLRVGVFLVRARARSRARACALSVLDMSGVSFAEPPLPAVASMLHNTQQQHSLPTSKLTMSGLNAKVPAGETRGRFSDCMLPLLCCMSNSTKMPLHHQHATLELVCCDPNCQGTRHLNARVSVSCSWSTRVGAPNEALVHNKVRKAEASARVVKLSARTGGGRQSREILDNPVLQSQ